MIRTRVFRIALIATLAVSAQTLTRLANRDATAQPPPVSVPTAADHGHRPGDHKSGTGAAHGHHEHPAVPAAYASVQIPPGVWTDPKMIAGGQGIFAAKCALCHGGKGDGKGPGAANLPLKPADLTDGKMVAEMTGSFWMWRVSEGGLVEPFRSKGSAMPAWKGELSVNARWAVIAYAHTLSGHRGPHDAREHPELRPRPKFVTGEGTVIALRPDKQQVVLEHGEIEGFMEAMTMGYKTSPAALMNSVKPGDKVRFTIDTDARAIIKLDRLTE